MPSKLLSLVKLIALLLFSILMAGCANSVDAMNPVTETATSPSHSADQENISLLPSDGSSFYYYSDGARIQLTPSLKWIAVKFVSSDPAEQSAAVQGSIVDSPEQTQQLPDPEWILLPLRQDMPMEELIDGINALRADRSQFWQVNPVFQADDAEMIVTDQFFATFSAEKGKEEISAINSSQGVEIVEPILGQANTYILRVTEEAGLDALSMANLYQETGLAMDAAPNFIRIIQK